uniref:Uncharacterized protein n=1 Tax=Chromera velia CCMP2878 TaxID=1169474 RepID=A0A0G4GAL6_9ALVE|eukprot:Cvel_21021.t1-p1 / transcript=Cvel_21021.t1 / gene=Cvel_21021 / organism=Chromera_velia_CCMP2878 / gene_product=hypothetical protein / transcript_product=hypothetical protein / location=Cvel_scaffold1937:31061-32705(-) / protein_length=461 / sequence_SO=supercontig / SO=protein_coding / is_pseudo=false
MASIHPSASGPAFGYPYGPVGPSSHHPAQLSPHEPAPHPYAPQPPYPAPYAVRQRNVRSEAPMEWGDENTQTEEEEDDSTKGWIKMETGNLLNVYVASCFNSYSHEGPDAKRNPALREDPRTLPHPWLALVLFALTFAVQVIAIMAINPGLYNLDNSFFNSTTPQPLVMVRAVVQVLALSNDIAAFSVLSVFLRTVALILVCLKVISSVREDMLGFNVMRLRNIQKLQVRSYGTEWVAYPLLFLSTIAFPAQVMLTAAHGILSAEMEMGEVILASVEILFILELDDQVVAQGISSVFPRTLQLSDIKVPKSCLKKSDTEAIIDECIRLGANSALFELEGGKYKEVQRKNFDKFKRQTILEMLDGITTNLMKGALPFLFTFATPALFLGILSCLVFGMEFIDFDQQDAASFQFHMHLPMGVVLVCLASGLSGCAVAFAMVTTEAIGDMACRSKDCCDEMSLI